MMAISRIKIAFPLLASLLVPAVAAAQQNPFVGGWQCVSAIPAMNGNPSVPVYSYDVYDASGRLKSTSRIGDEITITGVGTYQILPDNLVRGTFEDYNPKQLCAGQQGCIQLPSPPPVNARYRFLSPTSLMLSGAALVNGQTMAITENCNKVR